MIPPFFKNYSMYSSKFWYNDPKVNVVFNGNSYNSLLIKYLTAATNSLIILTSFSPISADFLISVNYLIPSRVNDAVPLPLNSESILNTLFFL
jgi:hypothetical protein